jgi:hypothetical protein
MWNLALIKSWSMARVSATSGVCRGRLSGWGWVESPPIGASPTEPSPWDRGLGGVFLGYIAGLELYVFSIGFGLGIALLGEAFWGLGAFVRFGELLVPLGLSGLLALDSDFGASGLRVSSALDISSFVSGAFVEESATISCGALYDD